MQAEIGHLCHSRDGHLVFNRGNGHLVYRGLEQLGEAVVTIEWFNSDRDLDLLGYWEDAPDRKCGYGHSYSGPYNTGVYQSSWSGDNTSEAGTEWIRMRMVPWAGNGSRRYFVHFNFFGEGSSCTVYVEQNGKTVIKQQGCANRRGSRAEASDPSCVITFNADGSIKAVN